MKYLYKILRLFLCPHKYMEISINGYEPIIKIKNPLGDSIMYYKLIKTCKYCGNIKIFET